MVKLPGKSPTNSIKMLGNNRHKTGSRHLNAIESFGILTLVAALVNNVYYYNNCLLQTYQFNNLFQSIRFSQQGLFVHYSVKIFVDR